MKRSLSKQYAHLAALRKSGANVLIPFAISSRLTEFKALEKSNEVIEVKPASIRVWGQLDAPKDWFNPALWPDSKLKRKKRVGLELVPENRTVRDSI